MAIQVYTYFGRIVKTFNVPENETHHKALEQARKLCVSKPHWIRFIGM